MMDYPDYMSNMQEGMTRLMNDPASAMRRYADAGSAATHARPSRECGCDDCHCECCVCDADVLVHARCAEIRRIPITFENDTRRERPVKLELGKFVTCGGRDLGWEAKLSETEFTLPPCGERMVTLAMHVDCLEKGKGEGKEAAKPNPNQPANVRGVERIDIHAVDRVGKVDRCEVGYATIRAEGCLTRPIVVAVAVLPDDCDAYHHPCGCGCCH
jgi:hypothetical protein